MSRQRNYLAGTTITCVGMISKHTAKARTRGPDSEEVSVLSNRAGAGGGPSVSSDPPPLSPIQGSRSRSRVQQDSAHISVPGSSKAHKPCPLTKRELEIVQLIVQGQNTADISERLDIGNQTVKNHIHHIFIKLGVSDRLELALYAIHNGLHLVPTAILG